MSLLLYMSVKVDNILKDLAFEFLLRDLAV